MSNEGSMENLAAIKDETKSEGSGKSPRKQVAIFIPVTDVNTTKSEVATLVVKTSKLSASNSAEISPREHDKEDNEAIRRIQKLIEKTTQMEVEAKERREKVDEQFKSLKDRLNNSAVFLKATKNQIENIKFKFQSDILKLNNELSFGDCLQDSNKTIEDLDAEMEEMQKKLDDIETRFEEDKYKLTETNFNMQNFESTLAEAGNTLESLGMGNYDEKNAE